MGGGSTNEKDETPAIVSSAGLLNDILLQTVVFFCQLWFARTELDP